MGKSFVLSAATILFLPSRNRAGMVLLKAGQSMFVKARSEVDTVEGSRRDGAMEALKIEFDQRFDEDRPLSLVYQRFLHLLWPMLCRPDG